MIKISRNIIIAGVLIASVLLLLPIFAEATSTAPLKSETAPSALELPSPINSTVPSTSFADEPTTSPHTVDGQSVVSDTAITFQLGSLEARIAGKKVQLLTPPMVVDGRTLLPLRVIAQEALGAQVVYDPKARQIIVTKDKSNIRLVLGSRTAFVNGEASKLDVAPQIIEGVALLPVRFLSEKFGLSIAYDAVLKTITIDSIGAKLPDPNQPPVANFSFPSAYIAGQQISVIDQSYDPEGDKLVARQWMVNQNRDTITSNLSSIFSKPRAGNYDISMRVKDSKGSWSEWTSAYVTITSNQVPVITGVEVSKESYARGEFIDYKVSYVNEEWEQVVLERWSYKKVGDNVSQPIFAKPKRIFDEGEYIVVLQIQDQYGNWSSKFERRITINSILNFKEFVFKFNNGELGETIANFSGFNFLSFPDAPKQQWLKVPGTLYFSNSPEKVSQKGILYQDRILGEGRAVIHHINNFNPDVPSKRLVVLVYNDTATPQVLTTSNMTMLDPSTDILYLGQQLLYRYFLGRSPTTHVIAPNSFIQLYESNGNKWIRGNALTGMFDFNASGELRMVVGVVDRTEAVSLMPTYGFPARDVHPRGTFSRLKENIYVDLTGINEPTKIIIGKSQEEWLIGLDAITGSVVYNRGNYGLEYHIIVTASERTAVILNPRGSIYNGAIKWVNGPAFTAPSDGFFVGGKDRASFLGVVEAGQTREFIYMLPNGSASPILFGFIPDTHWK